MKVSVLGATGYAGAELLRILYQHPQADVVHITSESHTGESIASLYPHLRGLYDMKLESMQDIRSIGEDSDFIFIGLPHGHAMEVARALADLPVRILGEAHELTGTCVGVDDDGALLLQTAEGLRRVLSGDVSLRLA